MIASTHKIYYVYIILHICVFEHIQLFQNTRKYLSFSITLYPPAFFQVIFFPVFVFSLIERVHVFGQEHELKVTWQSRTNYEQRQWRLMKGYDIFLYIRLSFTNHSQNHIKNLIISIIKLKGGKGGKRKNYHMYKRKIVQLQNGNYRSGQSFPKSSSVNWVRVFCWIMDFIIGQLDLLILFSSEPIPRHNQQNIADTTKQAATFLFQFLQQVPIVGWGRGLHRLEVSPSSVLHERILDRYFSPAVLRRHDRRRRRGRQQVLETRVRCLYRNHLYIRNLIQIRFITNIMVVVNALGRRGGY